MKYVILSLAFFITLFLQSTLVTWPLVLVAIIVFFVLTGRISIFGIACLIGIITDLVTFQSLGVSSIYFVLMCGVIFLYQRKYEIRSPVFVFLSTFFFSFFYGVLLIRNASIQSALITSCIALGIFFLFSRFLPQKSIRV